MPQMFPMPFIFLMTVTMLLFLLSVIRVYWQSPSFSSSKLEAGGPSNFYFNQTW